MILFNRYYTYFVLGLDDISDDMDDGNNENINDFQGTLNLSDNSDAEGDLAISDIRVCFM